MYLPTTNKGNKMATSAHFKTSTQVLARAMDDAGIVFDVYGLLNLADLLVKVGHNFAAPVEPDYRHEVLVSMAMKANYCLNMVQDNRPIMAIKELRTLALDTGVFPEGVVGTLMPCKKAIEDSRVVAAAALWSNPWVADCESEGPPF